MKLLEIRQLEAYLEEKKILSDVNLEIFPAKIHCLMGPNGSGKSTLAQVLMGHPAYRQTKGKLLFMGHDLAGREADERARLGLFLAFQNPVSVPGVNVANLLRMAVRVKSNGQKKGKYNPALTLSSLNEEIFAVSRKLDMPREFLKRSLNEEFSGGEKKKLEMLQALVLAPKLAVFDEIDTGLDVDALKIVAEGINRLKKIGSGILLITHYQRITKYARPDYVHILSNGRIAASGGMELAEHVEKDGYRKWIGNS